MMDSNVVREMNNITDLNARYGYIPANNRESDSSNMSRENITVSTNPNVRTTHYKAERTSRKKKVGVFTITKNIIQLMYIICKSLSENENFHRAVATLRNIAIYIGLIVAMFYTISANNLGYSSINTLIDSIIYASITVVAMFTLKKIGKIFYNDFIAPIVDSLNENK